MTIGQCRAAEEIRQFLFSFDDIRWFVVHRRPFQIREN
jgi:hypothetical protein